MSAVDIVLLLLVSLQPPAAKTVPFEITVHGHTRVDDYYWMRSQEDPAVTEYLEAENRYADSVMGLNGGLIDTLAAEMRSRIPELDSSVPYYRNGYWYWHEYRDEEDYAVNMRRAHPDGEEEILLDENRYAEGRDYFMVEEMIVSPDNSILAWAYDTTGGHWNTLVFQDIRTGGILDSVHNASGDLAWASDSRTVFYGLNDPTGRTDRIMRRTVGCDDEVCVFTEDDPTFWPWVWNSVDMEWVVITTSSTMESECRVLSADSPGDGFRVIFPRMDGLEYYVQPLGNTFYFLTNLQGENLSVMSAPAENCSLGSWRTVLPHSDSVLMEKIDVFHDFIAVSVRSGGLRKLLIMSNTGGGARYADIGEEASTIYTTSNYDASSDSINLWYSSMTTPWSTVTYDIAADSMRVLKTEYAGEDFHRELYTTERLLAPAGDGVTVPVSIVYREDLFRPGESPLVLYGYGAYGSSLDPSFSSTRLSLLDRGFVYAIAHVRGGREMGHWWYDQGRLMSKKNTFTDFIHCAEYLIDKGYCRPDGMFAMGESAGGLLMGAVVNMRPDLWRGVIAGVPFVDVLTTMLDPTIPLTTSEYDEWGNPGESREAYFYILSYSPVDNLQAVDYPAMYIYTGINDAQVGYWEPAKWVAGIRRLNSGDRPVLLRTSMGTGHGGPSGRFGWLRDIAEQYAFLLTQAGLD